MERESTRRIVGVREKEKKVMRLSSVLSLFKLYYNTAVLLHVAKPALLKVLSL